MKVKISGIRPEVDKLIKDAAEFFGLYDPRIPEEDQCTGYYAFREMCLMKEDICTYNQYINYDPKYHKEAPVGYYLISKLHTNARIPIINGVNKLREVFKNGEAAKAKVKKK